ncbi:MAG: hypothetical protein A2V98_25890 [Planctomycetes bacterium RBG_16_64_12]|nr:MAG: hypothetical protein A2V98_25890 [Planctomycetes bacterium RBG_16_64_12]
MSHGLYAVKIGSTVLGGITQQNVVTAAEVRGEASSGEIYSRIQSLVSQGFTPSFSTLAIAAALGACGALGASLASANLILYAQKHQDGGGRASGSVHRSFTFVKGILAPKQLQVDHRGDATLSYDAVVVYDGVNEPLVIGDTVALPSLGSSQAERFTLGSVEIGGVTLTTKMSLSIDFGLDVISEGHDSNLYDTIASIRGQQTVLTLTGRNPEWIKSTNIPLYGKAGTHLNTAIYLRKRADGGSFVADETAEHIAMTACGFCVPENIFQASGKDYGSVGLRMPLKYDGTNAPLVIDVAAALP